MLSSCTQKELFMWQTCLRTLVGTGNYNIHSNIRMWSDSKHTDIHINPKTMLEDNVSSSLTQFHAVLISIIVEGQ